MSEAKRNPDCVYNQVEDALNEAWDDGYCYGYGDGMQGDNKPTAKDVSSIIALIRADERKRIREVLLSDEVKAAAGKSMYQNREIGLDQAGDDDWDVLPWQDEWIEGAEYALTAALTAAGITGAGQEGGE